MKWTLLLFLFSAFCFFSSGTLQAEVWNTGESLTDTKCENGVCTIEHKVLVPDSDMVSKLKAYFEPLQENSQYYGDRRFRKKLRAFEVNKIKSYKANFGKKIWVKSWTLKELKKKMPMFGRKIIKKKFYLTAIEVAEDVAPYLKKELANTDVDFDTWSNKIEEFGRTYVNPEKAGKKKCRIEVADYQNGNYLMIQATKPFTKKMIYFIGEDNNVIVEKLLAYKTREERK